MASFCCAAEEGIVSHSGRSRYLSSTSGIFARTRAREGPLIGEADPFRLPVPRQLPDIGSNFLERD
jgi:hypothetical protein